MLAYTNQLTLLHRHPSEGTYKTFDIYARQHSEKFGLVLPDFNQQSLSQVG
ncbi:Bgt-20584 [Blumeria graminis f. sp. tritici]|uniref:Bgt-20584 n=2 Tax=Blumeria graminis f. sp. tritici TaxID=62690 RepID=A0A9X9QG35_BLUGR|nr:Bgt-20584 [Blumeria graminis f. sp. tritici]